MAGSDGALVRRALEGDHSAFTDLVERYTALVAGVAYEAIRRPDVVEDLVQEVFCQAFEKLPQLSKPSRFGPWLRSITAHRVNDWFRRREVRGRKESQQTIAMAHGTTTPLPDEELEAQQMADALWEVVDGLAPELRKVVVLRYVEGCSLRDMSQFLGVSVTTIKWRLRRGLGRLRGRLAEEHLRAAARQSRSDHQRLRQGVLAALPLALFVPPPEPSGWLWWWRRRPVRYLVAGGSAGLLGLTAVGSGRVKGPDLWPTARYPVSLEERSIPATSSYWEPARPQAGEPVQIQVAGEAAQGSGGAWLHYLTGATDREDKVVAMRREGEALVARLRVPDEAQALFYYVDEEPEPHDFGERWAYTPRLGRQLRKYGWSLPVHDEAGRPVEGAHLDRALMAMWSGQGRDTALGRLDRELQIHPDNIGAYNERWRLLSYAGAPAERVAAAQEEEHRVRRRYADDPAALARLSWLRGGVSADEALTLLEKLPSSGEAARLGWMTAMMMRRQGKKEESAALLEDLVARGRDGPGGADLLFQLMTSVGEADPMRSARMADSLLSSPECEGAGDAEARLSFGNTLCGATAAMRFELCLREGDGEGARTLAEGLLAAPMSDPYPYEMMGGRLAGAAVDGLPLRPRRDAAAPLDVELGLALLEAGLAHAGLERLAKLNPWQGGGDRRFASLIRARRQRSRYLRVLGEARLTAGRYEAAADALGEAAKLTDRMGDLGGAQRAYLQQARAWEELGRVDEAAQAYVDALELTCSMPEAERALARLQGGDGGTGPATWDSWRPRVPHLTVRDLDGEAHHLPRLDGRPVLVVYDFMLHPLDSAMVASATQWQQDFAAEGMEVIAVVGTANAADEAPEVVATRGIQLPVVVDDGEVYEALEPLPSCVLLIHHGRLMLRTAWSGYRQEEIGGLIRHCLGVDGVAARAAVKQDDTELASGR